MENELDSPCTHWFFNQSPQQVIKRILVPHETGALSCSSAQIHADHPQLKPQRRPQLLAGFADPPGGRSWRQSRSVKPWGARQREKRGTQQTCRPRHCVAALLFFWLIWTWMEIFSIGGTLWTDSWTGCSLVFLLSLSDLIWFGSFPVWTNKWRRLVATSSSRTSHPNLSFFSLLCFDLNKNA